MNQDAVLEIGDLAVRYPGEGGHADALTGISLTLRRGETVGLAGESGSGKTTLGLAVLRVLPTGARVLSGSVHFRETGNATAVDLLSLPEEEMRLVRGRRIAMTFQGAASSFSPVTAIGEQIAEAVQTHLRRSRAEAWARVRSALLSAGLEEDAAGLYPHQLSGGMAQRAALALAIACGPDILIADEPTAALDPSTKRHVLDTLAALQKKSGLTVLHIAHDLPALAYTSQRLAVLFAGRLVEIGPTSALLRKPVHHYTASLVAATPRLRGDLGPALVDLGAASPPAIRGCPYASLCPAASHQCIDQEPVLRDIGGRAVACWHPRTG